jgi:hypothetical protein
MILYVCKWAESYSRSFADPLLTNCLGIYKIEE